MHVWVLNSSGFLHQDRLLALKGPQHTLLWVLDINGICGASLLDIAIMVLGRGPPFGYSDHLGVVTKTGPNLDPQKQWGKQVVEIGGRQLWLQKLTSVVDDVTGLPLCGVESSTERWLLIPELPLKALYSGIVLKSNGTSYMVNVNSLIEGCWKL